MSQAYSHQAVTITQQTRAEFSRHLRENPTNRRISQEEKSNILGWLTDSHRRPTSQKEFSRRHYARKTFSWDEETQNLINLATKQGERDRAVVTEDRVADVIVYVHEQNRHAGWDATWKAVNESYYGIMRQDVIFILRRCQVCQLDPRKRPKGYSLAGYGPSTGLSDPSWAGPSSVVHLEDWLNVEDRLANDNMVNVDTTRPEHPEYQAYPDPEDPDDLRLICKSKSGVHVQDWRILLTRRAMQTTLGIPLLASLRQLIVSSPFMSHLISAWV
jgi:hypothetical protein